MRVTGIETLPVAVGGGYGYAVMPLFPDAPRAAEGYVVPPDAPGLGLELDEAEARKRPSRNGPLPSRRWPDGGVADPFAAFAA